MSKKIAMTMAHRTRSGSCTSVSCEEASMVFTCRIAALVQMEPLRRRHGALVWQNDQIWRLPVQGLHALASGKRQDGIASIGRNHLGAGKRVVSQAERQS
jgi:hypothetical protein